MKEKRESVNVKSPSANARERPQKELTVKITPGKGHLYKLGKSNLGERVRRLTKASRLHMVVPTKKKRGKLMKTLSLILPSLLRDSTKNQEIYLPLNLLKRIKKKKKRKSLMISLKSLAKYLEGIKKLSKR